ncbi:DUF4114 domain-containing protein [Aquimarina sp. TRL1]|uniref:DUF4114 domain-containing protein n=1 Tax=Aquimarina sp. (strain TRL1) TaxID=2736252 RepID=UPI00158E0FDF|nr:DUF4114 domain-containing protein [Aquimarina sp. TRL1]QKX07243.1 DUF4114 domain-containing protein [Aquimarina sp. TRL1]
MKKNYTFFFFVLISLYSYAQNFQYLGSYSANGTPDYLESPGDNISIATLELIDTSLPETFQVPTYNPHYITSNYDTDVFTTQETEVFVTFVSEGAGFRNVLGYYTYDLNNPPTTTPTDEEITIIFPNVSALGSGGGLQAGDKVSIGTFPAGTGIGWVLLSNGWNGSQVGYGYWQLFSNPDFNPETDVSKRYHNVLIKDDTEEIVILGFEDIHREFSWCDHDFNDTVFYVTATEYNDLNTTNNISTSSATNVFSGNLGGFESNGDLASLIAQRGLDRLKNNNQANTKKKQAVYNKRNFKKSDLGYYFPETGMMAYETPHISTSTDLINYANADDVFSIDYYVGENRVSAGIVTSTTDRIYDHSKTTCDRLNASTLLDVRPVTINNHNMIFSIMERNNGAIEYTISFSIKLNDNDTPNELFSLWNIGDYPEGNYKNFQLWGDSMGQVAHLANYILNILSSEKELTSSSENSVIPTVYISSATYTNQQLQLRVINTSNAKSATIDGNIRRSEHTDLEKFTEQVSLTGEHFQDITIDTGFLFDIGLSFSSDTSPVNDAIYLADGPWGIDYNSSETVINDFTIAPQIEELVDDPLVFSLERSIKASGTVTGTCNIFRTVLPGDLALDAANYESVQFYIKNNTPIEVTIIPENLTDWSQRLRYQLPINTNKTPYTISIEDFVNEKGVHDEISTIRTVLFSIKGDYVSTAAFELEIKNLALGVDPDSLIDLSTANITSVTNYPNPFSDFTMITVPEETPYISLWVYDLLGRVVYNATIETIEDSKSIKFDCLDLKRGMYKYVAIPKNQKEYNGTFIIK